MNSDILTIFKPGTAEIEVKRSIFIGFATHVNDEAQALAVVEARRALYPDATHTVYAYSLRENNTSRFCDDGEPHGTSGVPVLEVIRKSGLSDICICVTRYFGGTLLGAGGLVRAYTAAANAALEASERGSLTTWYKYLITLPYQHLDKFSYELGKISAKTDNAEYTENVTLTVSIAGANVPLLEALFSSVFHGQKLPGAIKQFMAPLPEKSQ